MMKAILVHGIAPSLIDPPAGECIVVESHRMGHGGGMDLASRQSPQEMLLARGLCPVSMEHIDKPRFAELIAQRREETLAQQRSPKQQRRLAKMAADFLDNRQSFTFA